MKSPKRVPDFDETFPDGFESKYFKLLGHWVASMYKDGVFLDEVINHAVFHKNLAAARNNAHQWYYSRVSH